MMRTCRKGQSIISGFKGQIHLEQILGSDMLN